MRFAHITGMVFGATVGVGVLFSALPARTGEALVFAAASTTEALREAAEAFARSGKGQVRGVFAGSSVLAKQIENGAPADLYLSANPVWMDYLEEQGHIDTGSRRDLLANRLVVITTMDSGQETFDVQSGLVAALDGGWLALGDPDHVPAGIYARQALEAMGLWPVLETRLLRTADVRIALRLVERGEADLGIVYVSDAAVFSGVRAVGEIASDLHEPIRYSIGLVAGRDNDTAQSFLDFLNAPEIVSLFRRHGFQVP